MRNKEKKERNKIKLKHVNYWIIIIVNYF